MKSINVTWSEGDLISQIIDMGFEATEENIEKVKNNGLISIMDEAMTQAGWDAMSDVIRMTLVEEEDDEYEF